MAVADLKSLFSGLLNLQVRSVLRIGGGRNSQVYRLESSHSSRYAAKRYFRDQLDGRDRLGVEFSSLQYLWDHGVRGIPRPVAADVDQGCAVYEFIEGVPITADQVTEADIDFVAGFLGHLKVLAGDEESSQLPPASEACFSVQTIIDQIETRQVNLSAVDPALPLSTDLKGFLAQEFDPALHQVIEWCDSALAGSGNSFTAELPRGDQTLSPSDFGFHNALRAGDGRIVFVDFEYFGWDDPAKMISDFLLHPGMSLSEDLSQRFVTAILDIFQAQPSLAGRLEVVHPLFGLKWCLILLNEFIPGSIQRREFAGGSALSRERIQGQQLEQAREMLQRVRDEYEGFKYRV